MGEDIMFHDTNLRSMKMHLCALLATTAALTTLLSACGAPPVGDLDGAEEEALSEQADELAGPASGRLTCAVVRCMDGFVCEERKGRAACVPAPMRQCVTDADCSLVDNYCGGCNCNAVPTGTPAPKCPGDEVACFVAPCSGLTASCQAGACVIANEL
jgi:hypothetical protein